MSEILIAKYAEKIGVTDSVTIQKAVEYLRTLNTKNPVKAINDTAKTVICLDLAAVNIGSTVDKNTIYELSTLRKWSYNNNFNTIEKILAIDKPKTISEICVQLQCTEIETTAKNILNEFFQNVTINDKQHPQYVAAAVYTACHLKNIKINTPSLIASSHLKKYQWKQLINEFEKFTNTLYSNKKIAEKRQSQQKELKKYKNDDNNYDKLSNKSIPNKCENIEIIEEYSVWKERILRNAYAKINSQLPLDCT